MMRLISMLAPVLTLLLAATVAHANWPHYLGPNSDGISPDTTPLAASWPADGPPARWSAPIEHGYSGASIADGVVYIMDRIPGEKDILKKFDLATGAPLGEASYAAPGRVNFPGSRSVPTVTDKYVFTSGPFGVFTGWDRETLDQLWQIDAPKDLGGSAMMFGYSGHPIAYNDLVILNAMGSESTIIATDQATGDIRWKSGLLHSSLSTPILRNFLGRDTIMWIGSGTPENPGGPGPYLTSGLDPATGEILWSYDGYPQSVPITPPIVLNDHRLLLTGGYSTGSSIVDIAHSSPASFTEIKSHPIGSQICPPVVIGDHIYALVVNQSIAERENRWPQGGLTCMDLDGNVKWSTGGEPWFGRGSMIAADGKLIIRDTWAGKLYLIAPSPEGYKQLAVANPFNETGRNLQRWAPLAIHEGLLIIRGQSELKCLDLRNRDS